VCGSAHCNFIPFWAEQPGRDTMTAYQASPRGGVVYCVNGKDRVLISGHAELFSEGTINF
ncbi:MAG: PhzF family phenazine biosynthesis protein, partial [Lachnospiraceae bacterium]|nr:PhzF family phenazine biosynthesis protein [Lachnospiraceae bacterium]